jgi:F0F1-type ATP synthase assembly protein I
MSTEVGKETNTLAGFLSATLTMSWQLAVAVLLPIIGGFELDRALNTKPFLTITGFILAIAGVSFIVWRQYQVVRSLPIPPMPPKSKASHS